MTPAPMQGNNFGGVGWNGINDGHSGYGGAPGSGYPSEYSGSKGGPNHFSNPSYNHGAYT